jgi:hypothetical protein
VYVNSYACIYILIYELKVSLEETATNNYVYLARREMEFAIKSRTGAMVPLRLREALESLKDLSPLSRSATETLVEAFVDLWVTEWAGCLVGRGLSSRPYAAGAIWGNRVHMAHDAATSGEGMTVKSWVPTAMMDALEDLLVEVEADPGLPEEAGVILHILRRLENGVELPVQERAKDVLWEELYQLAMVCSSHKRSRFQKIFDFQGPWHRALQEEHARRRMVPLGDGSESADTRQGAWGGPDSVSAEPEAEESAIAGGQGCEGPEAECQ